MIREYIWLNGAPVAVVEGGVIYYVRTDHIGRPVFATNAAGVKVWTASYLPFGGVRTSTGSAIALRFPGQWFQSESGLHQNWMRDYDPTTGRYIQADPLGLIDGASVYGYVKGNPGNWIDPRGEFAFDAVAGGLVGGIEIGGAVIGGAIAGAIGIILTPTQLGDGTLSPSKIETKTDVSEECPDDCSPATAPFWNSLSHYRGQYRATGAGNKRLYYKWDYLHFCEVEVFDRRGNHMGAVDGRTGRQIKPPVPGRIEKGLR